MNPELPTVNSPRRGGKRPGAGAPKGNLNALKTGATSRRVRAVLRALAENPESRAVFMALAKRGALQRAQTRDMVLALARLMHDRPVAEEARRRIHEIADAHDAAVRDDRARDAIDRYERLNRDRMPDDRLDAEISRLALADLKARLAELAAEARARRLAQNLRRTNTRIARALLTPRRPREGQP